MTGHPNGDDGEQITHPKSHRGTDNNRSGHGSNSVSPSSPPPLFFLPSAKLQSSRNHVKDTGCFANQFPKKEATHISRRYEMYTENDLPQKQWKR